MSRRASGALLFPLDSDSPVSSWRTGSISTSLQTMLAMSASRSLSSLWRCIMKPLRLQTMALSTLKPSPHTQIDGLSAISQSYLIFRASRNSPLFRAHFVDRYDCQPVRCTFFRSKFNSALCQSKRLLDVIQFCSKRFVFLSSHTLL